MTATRASRAPVTRTELLKARLDEARAIHDAWNTRLRRAEAQHRITTRNGGDNAATSRIIAATEISVLDAASELRVAIEAWVSSCANH